MELQIERCDRVLAPLPYLWEEIDSLDQLLARGAHVTGVEVIGCGDRAQATTSIAWGPMKRSLSLDATILGVVVKRQIRYSIEAISIAASFEATIDLIPFGPQETKLDYRATLKANHPLAVRVRHVLTEMAEEYVDSLVGRVKARAEGRRLAEERLLS